LHCIHFLCSLTRRIRVILLYSSRIIILCTISTNFNNRLWKQLETFIRHFNCDSKVNIKNLNGFCETNRKVGSDAFNYGFIIKFIEAQWTKRVEEFPRWFHLESRDVRNAIQCTRIMSTELNEMLSILVSNAVSNAWQYGRLAQGHAFSRARCEIFHLHNYLKIYRYLQLRTWINIIYCNNGWIRQWIIITRNVNSNNNPNRYFV